METMNKVKCPNCVKGVLFAVDNSVICGKIEGKCSWCGAIVTYNVETKQYETIKTKNNLNK